MVDYKFRRGDKFTAKVITSFTLPLAPDHLYAETPDGESIALSVTDYQEAYATQELS